MYNLLFIPDEFQHEPLEMSMESGIIISEITGATGGTASLNTSQGFQQIGNSVQSASINGQNITVSGKILDGNTGLKRRLMKTFVQGARGRLVWEDTYFCEVWVRSAPTVTQTRHSTFIMQLYAPYPYWRDVNESVYISGNLTKLFSFPINYSVPHNFGSWESSTQINVVNRGDVETNFVLTISAVSAMLVNPKITNIRTEEYIGFNVTLEPSETVSVYRENGITFVKKTSSGETVDAMETLDEDSTLFSLYSGDNLIYLTAESGTGSAEMKISFYEPYVGVLSHGV